MRMRRFAIRELMIAIAVVAFEMGFFAFLLEIARGTVDGLFYSILYATSWIIAHLLMAMVFLLVALRHSRERQNRSLVMVMILLTAVFLAAFMFVAAVDGKHQGFAKEPQIEGFEIEIGIVPAIGSLTAVAVILIVMSWVWRRRK